MRIDIRLLLCAAVYRPQLQSVSKPRRRPIFSFRATDVRSQLLPTDDPAKMTVGPDAGGYPTLDPNRDCCANSAGFCCHRRRLLPSRLRHQVNLNQTGQLSLDSSPTLFCFPPAIISLRSLLRRHIL